MALVNEHFLKLPGNYFFSDLEKSVNLYKVTHPHAELIRLDSGDVALPLPAVCIEAMHRAIDDQASMVDFKGYAPEQGYLFLVDAILKHDYASRGVHLNTNEIFICDGCKSSSGSIGNILRHDNSIGVVSPTFPSFIESNVAWGRAGELTEDCRWSNVVYMPCDIENNFIPSLPTQRVDIIYLCNPNNPTGTVLGKNELKKWVNYAIENDTLILFDASYESYINDPDIPHSIYEIKGARKVAIEFRSFSKTAGFTGIRCGYMVIPQDITAGTLSGKRTHLNPLWKRYQQTMSNGISYISQRGAEAIYTTEGKKQIKKQIDYYLSNARIMKKELIRIGFSITGGDNSPYLWLRIPEPFTSWAFFEKLIYEAQVVTTPGSGFGVGGEGYLRLSAFTRTEQCREAIHRIETVI